MGDWRPSENSSSHPHFRLRSRRVFHGQVQSVVHEIEINPVDPYTRTGGCHANHAHAADALITGASRGIGRGIALKLAEQGVKRIAITTMENDAAAEDAARLLKERGAALW